MTVKPLHQNPALDGGPLGWSNCNTTCTAMLIAFATGNTKHPSGGDVRACVRNEDGSPDIQGGTNPSQNVAAAKRCWSVALDQRLMPFEDAWALGQRDDTMLSISISYAVVSGTRYDASPGFTGLHQIVLHRGMVYDPLADGRRAGIPTSPQNWPKDLLRRAAAKYANTGDGRAAVIVARAPAVQPTRYSVKFAPGAIWVYPPTGARRRQEFNRATSAPCTAPFTVPWAGGRKRLVTVTDGFLRGNRVEPGATHIALVTK